MPIVLDSFEDGDISEYSGDKAPYSVVTSTVYDGSYSLEYYHYTNATTVITRDDITAGPSDVPISAYVYLDNKDRPPMFGFGVQTVGGWGTADGYWVIVGWDGQSENLTLQDATDDVELAAAGDGSIAEDNWYEVKITEWDTNGNITVEINDTSGNQINSVSVTDNTNGAGGFGWGNWYDDYLSGTKVYAYFDYGYKSDPITAPTNVHFNDTTTEDQLTLDWDAVSGAAGYYVYRAEASGSTKSDYTQVADITSPPYTDTNLEDGEKYFYRVSSHD